jgi:hypothetical protein
MEACGGRGRVVGPGRVKPGSLTSRKTEARTCSAFVRRSPTVENRKPLQSLGLCTNSCHMKRRRLLQTAALALCPASCGKKLSPPAPFATLADLAAMLQAEQTTPQLLVEHFLERIAQIDRSGPRVNAIIELNPASLELARDQTYDLRNGKPLRSPLHGIPILIKDNIDTADAMHTTAGSLALRGHKPARDAALVTRLREAGAIILGKTNLSEWANIRSPNSTSGWSARGGLTRNPHKLTHSASGSSSGSAAAVAAGLLPRRLGRRRTAPSSARPAPAALSASNQRSDSSAGQASSRSRIIKTPQDR